MTWENGGKILRHFAPQNDRGGNPEIFQGFRQSFRQGFVLSVLNQISYKPHKKYHIDHKNNRHNNAEDESHLAENTADLCLAAPRIALGEIGFDLAPGYSAKDDAKEGKKKGVGKSKGQNAEHKNRRGAVGCLVDGLRMIDRGLPVGGCLRNGHFRCSLCGIQKGAAVRTGVSAFGNIRSAIWTEHRFLLSVKWQPVFRLPYAQSIIIGIRRGRNDNDNEPDHKDGSQNDAEDQADLAEDASHLGLAGQRIALSEVRIDLALCNRAEDDAKEGKIEGAGECERKNAEYEDRRGVVGNGVYRCSVVNGSCIINGGRLGGTCLRKCCCSGRSHIPDRWNQKKLP